MITRQHCRSIGHSVRQTQGRNLLVTKPLYTCKLTERSWWHFCCPVFCVTSETMSTALKSSWISSFPGAVIWVNNQRRGAPLGEGFLKYCRVLPQVDLASPTDGFWIWEWLISGNWGGFMTFHWCAWFIGVAPPLVIISQAGCDCPYSCYT